MKPPPTADLFDKTLSSVAAQLRNRLDEVRATLRHPGDKGTHGEDAVREVLSRYLPRRLAVGQGEVIDTNNRRSAQTDVVVANENQPFIYPQEEPGLFLIEGVDAAGEVKSVLTPDHLENAIVNSRLFKTLEALPGRGLRVAAPSDVIRFHDHRPWFLFVYESQLTLESIVERIRNGEGTLTTPDMQVDAVFTLDRGVAMNLGDGTGSFGVAGPDDTRYKGWVINPNVEQALFALIAWLSMVMPRVVRVTPLLPEYMTHVAR